MTTFLGVSPSEVCEWDTKASASDPRARPSGWRRIGGSIAGNGAVESVTMFPSDWVNAATVYPVTSSQ